MSVASTSIATLAGEAVQQRVLMYDKSGEEHYNLISALHKSVRNTDPDAALYWLARMFAAGEDPLYLARRVVRMAVEDIGLAAPEALNLCSLGQGGHRLSRLARRRPGAGRGGRLSLARAQVELRLHRLRRRAAGDRTHPPGAGPAAPAQRAHPPDEGTRLRQRLPLRPRRRGPRGRHGLPARLTPRPQLLPAHAGGPRKATRRSAWKRFAAFALANAAKPDTQIASFRNLIRSNRPIQHKLSS